MRKKTVALILLFGMLFCISGCTEADIPPKDRDFTVEHEEVSYSSEQTERLATDVAEIYAEISDALGFPPVKDKEKAEIERLFKEKFVSVLTEIPVYPDEIGEAVSTVRALLCEAQESSAELAVNIYTELSTIFGTDRFGVIIYEVQTCRLEERLRDEESKKGSYFYNQNAVDYYTSLLGEARSLGAQPFSEAMSVIMFMISASLGSVSPEDGLILIEGADLAVILRKQGERFGRLELTEADWQTVARICEEPIGDMQSVQFKNPMLLPLCDDGFFPEAARIMPHLLSFYSELTSDIPKESAELIINGEGCESASAICREIMKYEESFVRFLDRLEELMPKAGVKALAAVQKNDASGYADFLTRGSVSREELIASVQRLAELPSEENLLEVRECVALYISGINSVVAYTCFYKQIAE